MLRLEKYDNEKDEARIKDRERKLAERDKKTPKEKQLEREKDIQRKIAERTSRN